MPYSGAQIPRLKAPAEIRNWIARLRQIAREFAGDPEFSGDVNDIADEMEILADEIEAHAAQSSGRYVPE